MWLTEEGAVNLRMIAKAAQASFYNSLPSLVAAIAARHGSRCYAAL
jgi:hypothetical protein